VDRNVVIATVLIAIIMVVWLTWLTPPAPPPGTDVDSTGARTEDVVRDTLPDAAADVGPAAGAPEALSPDDSTVAGASTGVERMITVSTDLYEAEFSTLGATIRSWSLAEYQVADSSAAVQLVDSTVAGAVSLVFTSPWSRVYDTRAFYFETDADADRIVVDDRERTLTFRAPVAEGALEVVYTFAPGTYEVVMDVRMERAESFVTTSGYEVVWNGAIPFTEENHENEGQHSGVYARSGGEVEKVEVTSQSYDERSLRGQVDWVAVKSKYFVSAVIPSGATRGAELIGERFDEGADPAVRYDFSASLAMAVPGPDGDRFRMYVGPMEYYRIREYGLDLYDMVDYGWDFFEAVTRPLAKFVFIPTFVFLAKWLPNYGLVIIIFSILIKLLVHPLTKSSFTNMARMRELQPRMEAIKEKYSDNPQKQQEAMMKMYKETGVNPLGGCLPMLLQYPIIIALWQFLPQAIEIRQQGFLWAADLSAPDVILSLPFSIPLYGNFVAGFTLLMGLSMVIQMKLQATPGSNAQAKIFMYVFPVMIFVIFNKLASGLNLYYLCYNVLSAGHQKLINRRLEAKKAAGESLFEKKEPKAGRKGQGTKRRKG
jgi:YidC/Oxa1 family membrane protein insertase